MGGSYHAAAHFVGKLHATARHNRVARVLHKALQHRSVIGSARLKPDRRVIDEQDFFVRVCMEVPIVGASEPFL